MKKEKKVKEIEISEKYLDSEEDSDMLNIEGKIINYDSESHYTKENLLPQKNNELKENKLKKILKLPLTIKLLILIFFGAIILLIVYLFYYNLTEPNFKIIEPKWDIMDLYNKKYEYYIFDNGLEILLVQDPLIDKDGGCIMIEKGYMDDPQDEGIASFAGRLLDFIEFGTYNDTVYDDKFINIKNIYDYYGIFVTSVEEDFTSYRFDILNNGFLKFINYYSQILNIYEHVNISIYFDRYYDEIIGQIEDIYKEKKEDISDKEKHLLEYLVYGIKNEEGYDILPEGNKASLNKYSKEELKAKVIDFLYEMIEPKNIKIVFYSRYKNLITSKYIKKYFNYLITKGSKKPKSLSTKNKSKNEFTKNKFETSQIIFLKGNNYESRFIKILYYIDKKENENFSEFKYKSYYLNYIVDILDEKKEGSLYYLLNKTSKYNVKSIDAGFEYVLKSKIEFFIYIELNYVSNINDIILIVYQYMNKIIKEAIGENFQMDRYFELKNKFYQQAKYKENNIETNEFIYNNAKTLFLTDYEKKYFFYPNYVPWTDKDTEEKIKNDSFYYFNQIKPENSVIFVYSDFEELDYLINNQFIQFNDNFEFFRKEDIIKKTNYYDLYYYNLSFKFNVSEKEEYFDINYKPNITFVNNCYLSSHKELVNNQKNEETEIIQLYNKTSFYKFYFKRNTKFKIPKVFISLNLFHPYLRPMNSNENVKQCYYFKIIEMFSAMKRKINDDLADALRAGNEIDFGQNENYLFINIYCYEDMAYKIMEKIRNVFQTKWELSDFKSNNEFYKNEAFQDFLFNSNIWDYSLNSFYSKIKNNLFYTYDFFNGVFEEDYYEECIKDSFNEIEFRYLNTFIINGYIYGYYTKEQAQNISDLFEANHDIKDFEKILSIVNNSEIRDYSTENFVNWIKEIHELKNNEDIYIDAYIDIQGWYLFQYYKFGISYIKFNESILSVSLLENILERVYSDDYMYRLRMFKYGDIYFEFIFITEDISENIPSNEIINNSWNAYLYNAYEYNTPVDNIGNQYYYLKKNFKLNTLNQQKSLSQRAKDEFQKYLYEGTIIDPAELSKMYDKKYKNKKFDKKELNNTINYYLNILKRNRVDIYFNY